MSEETHLDLLHSALAEGERSPVAEDYSINRLIEQLDHEWRIAGFTVQERARRDYPRLI